MAEKIEAVRKKSKKVMVAIDESRSSYHALIWVLDNLKETICSSSTNTSLVLFSPQPLPLSGYYTTAAPFGPAILYFHGPPAPEVLHVAQENSRKVSLGLLEKAKEICAGRGVNVEIITEGGDPKAAICSAVRTHKIDLLIVGCEGYGFLKRIFKESTSDYCSKNAECSVLVVKKPKQPG